MNYRNAVYMTHFLVCQDIQSFSTRVRRKVLDFEERKMVIITPQIKEEIRS